LNTELPLSSSSNTSTAAAGAPSSRTAHILMPIDSSISSGWKRTPVETSKSGSL